MTESRVLNFDASLTFETAVKNAVEDMKNNPGTTLIIPPGRYTLSGELSREAMRKLFAGEFGKNPQKVMFNPKYRYDRGLDLTGLKNVKIMACGVTLAVEGYMEPVTVFGCKDIEICGLTVDHIRKPFSRGKVVSVEPEGDRLAVNVILNEGNEVSPGTPNMLRHLAVDPKTDTAVKTGVRDCRFISPRELCFVVEGDSAIAAGMDFYTWHSYHSRPAILLENSENVVLRDITVHSQPGMGIVGNRCENIYITGLRVVPSGGDRVSTNTDATHFTSCKGQLVLENCEASWHGDDFVNVHAYYQDVVGVEGEKTYYIQEKTPDGTHAQTLDYPDTGDVMELVSRKTLEKVGEYRVLDCEPLPDKWMCRVTLDRPLPAEREGLMLADITRLPDVTVRGCRVSSHFARSILLKNRSALVENCIFENAHGAGVVAAAEAWWSEGVCPSNITVRNNIIKNCGVFGSEGAIVVKADCDDPHGKNIFNINIENNSIDCPSCRYGILVRNADGVRITGNTANVREDAVKTVDCSNVEIK